MGGGLYVAALVQHAQATRDHANDQVNANIGASGASAASWGADGGVAPSEVGGRGQEGSGGWDGQPCVAELCRRVCDGAYVVHLEAARVFMPSHDLAADAEAEEAAAAAAAAVATIALHDAASSSSSFSPVMSAAATAAKAAAAATFVDIGVKIMPQLPFELQLQLMQVGH
jgi:hypothetical protein